MKQKEDRFLDYMLTRNDAEREQIALFFDSLSRQLNLGRQDTAAIRDDFEKALLCYDECGVSLSDALERLSPQRMGGFYAREAAVWYPLDSAAKVYPLAMGHGKMAVFRLSAYLKAPVVPELLQAALTFVMGRFPGFAVTVKKGFFWHYMDAWKGRYAVLPDDEPPCRVINLAAGGKPWSILVLWCLYMVWSNVFSLNMVDYNRVSQCVKMTIQVSILLLIIEGSLASGWAFAVLPIVGFGALVIVATLFFSDLRKQKANVMPMLLLAMTVLGICTVLAWFRDVWTWSMIVMAAASFALVAAVFATRGGALLADLRKYFHLK